MARLEAAYHYQLHRITVHYMEVRRALCQKVESKGVRDFITKNPNNFQTIVSF